MSVTFRYRQTNYAVKVLFSVLLWSDRTIETFGVHVSSIVIFQHQSFNAVSLQATAKETYC